MTNTAYLLDLDKESLEKKIEKAKELGKVKEVVRVYQGKTSMSRTKLTWIAELITR